MSNRKSKTKSSHHREKHAMNQPFGNGSAFCAAYDRRIAEIRAVPDDELVAVNLDVHAAVAKVLGALPKIKPLAAAMNRLDGLDEELVGGLEDYALAANEANSRYVLATTPPPELLALNEQGLALRDVLRTDAAALAKRGLIEPALLEQFNGHVGYKNVGFELVDYANLMRNAWSTIHGKTALTVEEVEAAWQLGEKLVRVASQRAQDPATVADAALIRQQALTLLVKSYEETRRAVVYLRWHQDDAEAFAPSLYGGRTRRHTEDPVPAPTPPAPAPVVNPTPAPPVVTNGPNGTSTTVTA
jgi:hypothetical protein